MTVLFNIDRIFNFFVTTFMEEKIRLGTTNCIIRNFVLKRVDSVDRIDHNWLIES